MPQHRLLRGGHRNVAGLFSQRLETYGGTLGQLAFQALLAVSFWRKGEAISFAVSVVWFFENWLNIARYMADARAQALPLVGGGDHDWARISAGEISPPPATPLKTGTLAAVVAGSYLMFSWFIHLTWSLHDLLATGIAAGTMLMLAFWSFFRLRGHSAATIAPALGRDVSLFGLLMLAILNLRMDVWVASAYGVTAAEAHDLQPIWIIPILSFALVAWSVLVIALTKPKSSV
ncbi:MAG: hypothetical protein ABSD28_20860 [Tepidisphaeraceae bacterium]|jgi:hypothetical protein